MSEASVVWGVVRLSAKETESGGIRRRQLLSLEARPNSPVGLSASRGPQRTVSAELDPLPVCDTRKQAYGIPICIALKLCIKSHAAGLMGSIISSWPS